MTKIKWGPESIRQLVRSQSHRVYFDLVHRPTATDSPNVAVPTRRKPSTKSKLLNSKPPLTVDAVEPIRKPAVLVNLSEHDLMELVDLVGEWISEREHKDISPLEGSALDKDGAEILNYLIHRNIIQMTKTAKQVEELSKGFKKLKGWKGK